VRGGARKNKEREEKKSVPYFLRASCSSLHFSQISSKIFSGVVPVWMSGVPAFPTVPM
jgi:hypothetical protein